MFEAPNPPGLKTFVIRADSKEGQHPMNALGKSTSCSEINCKKLMEIFSRISLAAHFLVLRKETYLEKRVWRKGKKE